MKLQGCGAVSYCTKGGGSGKKKYSTMLKDLFLLHIPLSGLTHGEPAFLRVVRWLRSGLKCQGSTKAGI